MILRLHPDGLVYFGDWACTRAELNAAIAGFIVPEGVAGFEYERGKIHRLYDRAGNVIGGDGDWPDADRIVAQATAIRARVEKERAAVEDARQQEHVRREKERFDALPPLAKAALQVNQEAMAALVVEANCRLNNQPVPQKVRKAIEDAAAKILVYWP